MSDGRGSNDGETLIFTCAGAAHSGQVANRVGVQLAKQQAGKLFCIAAVAADRPDKINRARKAKARVLIDGCEDECCRYVMEKAGLPIDTHVVLSNLGVEKAPQHPDLIGDTKRCTEHVVQNM
jgi:uncharacterized metal-binding protein